MPTFAAMKNPTSLFKSVQLDLFEALKLRPLDAFKNKDLQGPLKHLKPQTLKKAPSVAPSLISTEILGFPTVIKRQAYLRYIRFHLKPNGVLHITAPKNRPFEQIASEVTEHKKWVLERHQEFEEIRSQSPCFFWQDGQSFPFLGESYQLKLQAYSAPRALVQLDLDQLHFFYPETWSQLPEPQASQLLKKALIKFYKNKAQIKMDERTRLWSETMRLFPKKLSYRNQKTRWGSCSSQGNISLNWRLIAYSPELMDYIIIHELAHLKHQNHGVRFWALVEKFCPNYKNLRQELRQKQYFADFLAPESELYLQNPTLKPQGLTTKDMKL